MLSRTRFFFTKNSFVLNTLVQTKGCRLSIPTSIHHYHHSTIGTTTTKPLFKLNHFISSIQSRFYSTIPLQTSNTTPSSSSSSILTNTEKLKFTNGSNPISPKLVGYWLVGTSTLVFGIVVLGGLTRLTESGLSITEWKPVTGALPPLSQEDWEIEFTKYKDSPEFKQLNSHINLEEFKFIYSMEWGHRLVGRGIGLFFLLPAIIFWSRGKFSPHITRSVIGLTGLLGLQGFIGWWMVKSGLDQDQLNQRNSKPTVSQYRLTTHLGAAFLMYLGVLGTAFEILNENKWAKLSKTAPETVKSIFIKLQSPSIKKTRLMATGLLCLTFLTAMSGGMVAGLDAGLIYNTFPHMGDDIIPSYSELMSPVFARSEDKSDLWWRNILENPTTVQLVHRIFATTTYFTILAAQIYVKKNKVLLPKAAVRSMHGMWAFANVQVALGIFTLIYLVPIPLGAAHQAGALALLTTCLMFAARLKKPRPEALNYINKLMKDQLLKSRV
ncbi:cytochrome c oxidase assembly protein COX15 [Scheffersomyces coipomensis]|uniref:cytochrome c oxidase assembly protein COX15 n=1 Tax=Scheffersomyces coipomensis TaxID=1788519 RepID=UPI00315D79E7